MNDKRLREIAKWYPPIIVASRDDEHRLTSPPPLVILREEKNREHYVETGLENEMHPEKQTTTSVAEPGKLQQIIAAVTINLSAMAYGTMIGWASPMTPQLQSDDPPVGTTPMSDEAASWLGGALCPGALLGITFYGVIAEKFGRKAAGYGIAIPYGICWLITIFAENQNLLFAARFFAGFGGAGSMFLVPIYVSEIAGNKIRGMLGSLLVFFINIGILMAYVVGTLVSFRGFAICATILPMMYVCGFMFMPESPMYLVRNERISEAAKSLRWLRGGHESTVETELSQLRAKVKQVDAAPRKIGIADLFKDRTTRRGLVIAFGLLGGQQFCGIFAMINYTATIFKSAGSSLSPDIATIIVGAIQVFGSYLSTLLMERAGRRRLILISCAGMCACHSILGSFSFAQSYAYDVRSISWIPVVSLSAYVIVYSLGMGPAPFIVSSEVFSSETKGLANSLSMFVLWISSFVVVKFFATISSLVGIHGCFFIFAICCASTFLFTLVLVPETKGRTVESILAELGGVARPRSKHVATVDGGLDAITNSSAPLHV